MIEFQTSVAKVSVDFKDKINILLGDSGEGKSLLLKLLAVYFREHNIPFDTVDWNTLEEALWDRLNGNTLKSEGSYLLYDNGDITLTPEVYSKLIELPCTSIISMKRIQRVDCGLYDVIYNPGDLRVEKSLALTGLNLRRAFSCCINQLLISLRILITFHLI
jgi:hypothetical protein